MFNHEARWDRKLPTENENRLGVPIEVTCIMKKGQILPQSFNWNNKIHQIKIINFFWKSREGKEELLFFSVKTQSGDYQIVFSCLNLNWHLNKLLGPP